MEESKESTRTCHYGTSRRQSHGSPFAHVIMGSMRWSQLYSATSKGRKKRRRPNLRGRRPAKVKGDMGRVDVKIMEVHSHMSLWVQ